MKQFMLWEMGFPDAKIAPPPAYTPPGTIEIREGCGPLELSGVFLQSEAAMPTHRRLKENRFTA